jgi:hypothetical protein
LRPGAQRASSDRQLGSTEDGAAIRKGPGS